MSTSISGNGKLQLYCSVNQTYQIAHIRIKLFSFLLIRQPHKFVKLFKSNMTREPAPLASIEPTDERTYLIAFLTFIKYRKERMSPVITFKTFITLVAFHSINFCKYAYQIIMKTILRTESGMAARHIEAMNHGAFPIERARKYSGCVDWVGFLDEAT